MGSWCRCWKQLALTLSIAQADWIAWKNDQRQGEPSSGLWKPVPRSQRFEIFDWEGEEGKQAVNGYRYFFRGATHYTIGNTAGESIEVWQPFAEDFADSAVCANIRGALFNLYRYNLSEVHITVRSVGWHAVGEKSICQEGAPCPNLILVGSSQLAQRVVSDRVRSLNHFMYEYLQTNLERLQDDFPGVAYYEYFFGAHWMGIPFLSDVRLVAFNKTTLNRLNITLPPPHSLKESWSWQDLQRHACKIKDHVGSPGLLANSDFDEDFKFFTLMVQSAKGSLYKVDGEGSDSHLQCGLNSAAAVHFLESWWKRMIHEGCLGGHDGKGFWNNVEPGSEALAKILDLKKVDVVNPPNVAGFSNYNYDDPKRPNGTFESFIWSSGFDERMTIGPCSKESQGWTLNLVNWVQPCTAGPIVMDVDFARCKQVMLEQEFDTLTFQDGFCQMQRCINGPAAIKLSLTADWVGGPAVFSQHCSEILYANMPENHTFLGGSGLIIPKEAGHDVPQCHPEDTSEVCRRERHGWMMILELTNTKKPFIAQANLLKQQSVPAPRRSLAEQKAQNPLWIPVVNAIKRGVPSQYPNVPIPKSSEIEEIKPVRIAMLRSIYGNVSGATSLDCTCGILNELVRKCNRSRWQDDPRCVNPLDNKAGCEAGQHLRRDHFGSIKCAPCSMGKFAEARSVSEECQKCPEGSFSDLHASTSCDACPNGLVAQNQGQTACFNCSAGREPYGTDACRDCTAGFYQEGSQCVPCPLGYTSPRSSPSSQYCMPKPTLIWLNLALLLDIVCIVLLLPQFFGPLVAVNDIFLDEGKLVLKTWGYHQVSRWSLLPIKVRLSGTHHYLLNEENGSGRVFLVKWRDSEELYLMKEKGVHLTDDINSSRGYMQILPKCTLWGTSFCGIPAVLVMCVLLGIFGFCIYMAIQNGFGEEKHLPWTLSTCAVLSLLGLVIYYFVWRSRIRGTPLRRRRQIFQQRILKANPNPSESQRGPDRAINLEKISDLMEFFHDFIKDRDMHYVTNNLLLPLTKAYRLSYSDVVGPSRAAWFVSHCWNNSFKDFFVSLKKMAEGKSMSGNWRPLAFWICSFSNNQYKVKEELGDGDPLKSSFYMALQSPECQGTAMVLDNHCEPLQRSWCLFELLQTRYVAPKNKSGYEGLLLCTPSGVLQWGNADVDTVVRLAEKVGATRLENAQASNPKDKLMIDQCVIETVEGGFPEVNKYVHASIKKVLNEANGSFQLRVQDLMLTLDPEGSPTVGGPVLLGRDGRGLTRAFTRTKTREEGAKKANNDELRDTGCPL